MHFDRLWNFLQVTAAPAGPGAGAARTGGGDGTVGADTTVGGNGTATAGGGNSGSGTDGGSGGGTDGRAQADDGTDAISDHEDLLKHAISAQEFADRLMQVEETRSRLRMQEDRQRAEQERLTSRWRAYNIVIVIAWCLLAAAVFLLALGAICVWMMHAVRGLRTGAPLRWIAGSGGGALVLSLLAKWLGGRYLRSRGPGARDGAAPRDRPEGSDRPPVDAP